VPQLSIITVNLNNLEGLKKTMHSVFEQTFTDYEYIIIDGGSTDGSKEYIERHADKLAYWVSEQDGGIFNAMNKGIRVAKGEYLIFENSGDYFYSENVLKDVFGQSPTEDIIYGNVKWWPVSYNGNYPDELTFEHFRYNTIPHQGAFIKRSLFDKVGLYDEEYPVNSDWNFFILAIYKFNCSYRHVNTIISYCNTDGVSLTPEGTDKAALIRKEIIEKHFSTFEKDMTSLLNSIGNENNYYRNLLNQRIMKTAFRVNHIYQSFRKRLKKK